MLSVERFLWLLLDKVGADDAADPSESESMNSMVAIASSMACKLNLNCSQVWMRPQRILRIFRRISKICALVIGLLVCRILSKHTSTKIKVPERPIPAEQWTTLGATEADGCFEVTVCRNFKKVEVEAGTPKSGQVK